MARREEDESSASPAVEGFATSQGAIFFEFRGSGARGCRGYTSMLPPDRRPGTRMTDAAKKLVFGMSHCRAVARRNASAHRSRSRNLASLFMATQVKSATVAAWRRARSGGWLRPRGLHWFAQAQPARRELPESGGGLYRRHRGNPRRSARFERLYSLESHPKLRPGLEQSGRRWSAAPPSSPSRS